MGRQSDSLGLWGCSGTPFPDLGPPSLTSCRNESGNKALYPILRKAMKATPIQGACPSPTLTRTYIHWHTGNTNTQQESRYTHKTGKL